MGTSYHCHVSLVKRSAGHSVVASAAYDAGVKLEDERTGKTYDYTRKRGVIGSEIVMPEGCEWKPSLGELWNAVEHKNKREDSIVGREFEVALPKELSADERKALALEFTKLVADRYQVGASVGFHEPHTVTKRDLENKPNQYFEIDEKTGRRHNGNWHAHILTTTNRIGPDGRLGNKARELDVVAHDRGKGSREHPNEVEKLRAEWAEMGANALERRGYKVEAERYRAGHLPLAQQVERARERGDKEFVDKNEGREPTRHMGKAATDMERGKPLYRDGKEVEGEWRQKPKRSEIGDVNRRIEQANELGKIQREKASVGRSIIDTESSIGEALKERNSQFRDFLKGQRDNAGSRGTEKPPERHDWSRMQELAGSRGTERKNEREATPESIDAAIRGYAAQTGQQAPRNSLQERFGHLTKGQTQTEPEKRLEGPQREREAPQIITDPSAALAPRPSLADRFGHLVKDQPKREAETRLILPERMGGSTTPPKEKPMDREANGQQANRDEGAALRRMEQQPQEAPKQEQEQPRESQQQEQQNRLQQIAAQMEAQRMERERQKQQERERSGPDLSL